MAEPKILVLDIETKPMIAYAWRCYDENISPEQIIEPGGMISFAAKWVGESGVAFYSDWTHSHGEMVHAIHALLSVADGVVSYNGDRFDLPKLHGEFLLEGLAPPPPLTSIDVMKTVKKMGFVMNRLAFIGPLLKVGAKVKHEGFQLWADVLKGDEKAQAKMEKYNVQDVVLLEKLYLKIKPYIRNHPHMGDQSAHSCGACGSTHVQSRGYRRTKSFLIKRLQCQTCGSWSDGARTKVKSDDNG